MEVGTGASEVASSTAIPPYIVFVGTQKWDQVLALQAEPMIFLSTFELYLPALNTADPRLKFGLNLNEDEMRALKSVGAEQLPALVQEIKILFESKTGALLQHSISAIEPYSIVQTAFAQLGVDCVKAVRWSCTQQTPKSNELYFVEPTSAYPMDQLSRLIHGRDHLYETLLSVSDSSSSSSSSSSSNDSDSD